MSLLLEQYLSDVSRCGPPPEGSFTGAAGGFACGDLARLSLLPFRGRIERITFDAEGCAATRAACACVAEMVEGASILEAAKVSTEDVDRELGGLASLRATPLCWRPTPCTALFRRWPPAVSGLPTRMRTGCWSRFPAASTARSRRSGSVSAGPRSSRSRSSSGPIPTPTGPRPAAHRRRCSAHGRSPTRWTCPTSRSTSRTSSVDRGRGRSGRIRRRPHAEPLRALQRRGPDRGDGRSGRPARRDSPGHRPLRPDRRRRGRAVCWPKAQTATRTRATCWRRCRPR